jgi:hypothetical protein
MCNLDLFHKFYAAAALSAFGSTPKAIDFIILEANDEAPSILAI